MPGSRIPALTAIAGASTANDDNLVIFDTSTDTTKRILRSQLAVGLVGDLPYTPAGFIAATTVPTAIAEIASDVAASSGSSLVGYLPAGTGAVATTVQTALRKFIYPENYGAVGDGVADDTLAFVNMAADITNGTVIECQQGKTYLVAYTNAANNDAYGKKVMYLTGKSDVTIKGNGSTIKCVNHDITANGGLMFFYGESCPRTTIEGFRFDMTFTGVKNSSAFYPFCGAIIFADAQTGAQAQTALNSGAAVRDCSFKLYHPYGNWATTTAGNDFGGDSNNGFKLFSVFFSGDAAATAYANQNRNCRISDITFEDGHNGYGVWVWAYNDVIFDHIHGYSWVSKHSTNAGAVLGQGVPMIRHTQFYTSGVNISECNFRAKPCGERLVAGFEGSGTFCHLTQNLTGDRSNGAAIMHDNFIQLGNGDNANALYDYGVYIACYGSVDINNNTFDGVTETVNAYAGQYIKFPPTIDNGKLSLSICDNTFGISGSYNDGIVLGNGNNTSAVTRRIKSLIVQDNTFMSGQQYIVDTQGSNSAYTYSGIPYQNISNNTIIGTYDTVWGSGSINSNAMRLAASETSDILIVKNNIVIDKNRFIVATYVVTTNATIEDNKLSGVTTTFVGGTLIDFQNKAGTFTPTLAGTSTAGTPTFAFTPIGRYTRVANRCFFELTMSVTAAGGAVGNWVIGLNDIPYTSKNISANHASSCSTVYSNLAVGAGKELGAAVQNNSKNITLYAMDQAGGAVSSLTVAMDAVWFLYVSGSYEVA